MSSSALEITLVRIAQAFATCACAEELVEFLEALALQVCARCWPQAATVVFAHSTLYMFTVRPCPQVTIDGQWLEFDAVIYSTEWHQCIRQKYGATIRALQSASLVQGIASVSASGESNIQSSDTAWVDDEVYGDVDSAKLVAQWSLQWASEFLEPTPVHSSQPNATNDDSESAPLEPSEAEDEFKPLRSPSQLNADAVVELRDEDFAVEPRSPSPPFVSTRARHVRRRVPHLAAASTPPPPPPPPPPPLLPVSLYAPLSRLRSLMAADRESLIQCVTVLCALLSRADGSMSARTTVAALGLTNPRSILFTFV